MKSINNSDYNFIRQEIGRLLFVLLFQPLYCEFVYGKTPLPNFTGLLNITNLIFETHFVQGIVSRTSASDLYDFRQHNDDIIRIFKNEALLDPLSEDFIVKSIHSLEIASNHSQFEIALERVSTLCVSKTLLLKLSKYDFISSFER